MSTLSASLPRCLSRGTTVLPFASMSCGLTRCSLPAPTLASTDLITGYFSGFVLFTGYSSDGSLLSLEANFYSVLHRRFNSKDVCVSDSFEDFSSTLLPKTFVSGTTLSTSMANPPDLSDLQPQLWLLPCPVAALGVTLDAPPIRSVATVFTSPSVHASIHLDFGSSSTTPTYPVAKTLTDPRIFSWYGYTSIHRSYWIGYTTVLHPYLKLQDTQPCRSHLSSYHVQERSFASFSWLLERSIQPPSLLPCMAFWLLLLCRAASPCSERMLFRDLVL
ncbi:unnamed protein product [Arabidopsis halleri]